MTRQCLSGRRIGDLGMLQSEIAAWSTDGNDRQHGVDRRITIPDARCKLGSIYPKILLWQTTPTSPCVTIGNAQVPTVGHQSWELTNGKRQGHSTRAVNAPSVGPLLAASARSPGRARTAVSNCSCASRVAQLNSAKSSVLLNGNCRLPSVFSIPRYRRNAL